MQTVTLDGKVYVLVPQEQLQEVETPAPSGTQTVQDDQSSPLNDFLMDAPVHHPDDGLATNQEKQEAIRVVEEPQQTVVASLPSVPAAQPKKYAYFEKFKSKELMPSDVSTLPTYHGDLLAANPEDPMIIADKRRPKEQQLFYGPGTQQE